MSKTIFITQGGVTLLGILGSLFVFCEAANAVDLNGAFGPTKATGPFLTGSDYTFTGDAQSSLPTGMNTYGKGIFISSSSAQLINNTSGSPITISALGGTLFKTGKFDQTINLGEISKLTTKSGLIFSSGNSSPQSPQTQKITGSIEEIVIDVGSSALRLGYGLNLTSQTHQGAVFSNVGGVQIFGDPNEASDGKINKISILSSEKPGASTYSTNRGVVFLNYGEPLGTGNQQVYVSVGSIGEAGQRFGTAVLDVYGAYQYIHRIDEIYTINSGISAGTLATTSDGGPQYINSVGVIDVDNGDYSFSRAFGVFNWSDSGVEYEDSGIRHEGNQYVGLTERINVVSRFHDREAVGLYNRGGEQVIEAKPDDKGFVVIDAINTADGPAYSVLVSPIMDNQAAAEKSKNITTLKGNFTIANGPLVARNVANGQLYASISSINLLNSNFSGNALNLGESNYILIEKGEKDAELGKSTTYLTIGDDRLKEDPGYRVNLHRNSFINVQGSLRGRGIIAVHFDKEAFDRAKANDVALPGENGSVTWDFQGKGYGVVSGGVLMKNVEKTLAGNNSHLDVVVPISADEVPDEHFAYQVMRSAVNNLFVDEGIENIRERIDLEKWEDEKGIYEKYKYVAGKVYINEGKINGGYEEEYYYEDPEIVGNQNNIRDAFSSATLKLVPTDGTITDSEGNFVSYTSTDRKVTLPLEVSSKTTYNAVYLEYKPTKPDDPDVPESKPEEGVGTQELVTTPKDLSKSSETTDPDAPGTEIPAAGTPLALQVQNGKLGYLNKDGDFQELSVNDNGQIVDENGYPLEVTVTTDNAKAIYAWEGEIGEKVFEETVKEKEEKPTPENPGSSSTVDTIDSVSIADYYLWRLENETLYQRMGEVRDRADLEGSWVRVLGGKNTLEKGNYYFKHKYYGIQLGFDHVVNKEDGGGWIFGAGATYLHGKTDLRNNGSGKNWLGSLSVYGVKKFDNEAYLDLILKASRIHHDYTAISNRMTYISKGKYHTYALQASAEVGKKIMLNDEWYFDPQLQLSYGHIKGAKYRTSSEINIRTNGLNSLIGRVGASVGREFKEGSIFVKMDGLREFTAKHKAYYSLDSGARNQSEISLKDTWGEVTIGGTCNFNKKTYGFAQVKRSFASDVKQEFRADIGLRYVF
ncbi:autotransporter outer membrane beta-barrel domain-containing protein [Turicimonas muris]|uniref:autotransporter outer membrane beta-barrel domain-containing protein n=1 Tax=Turicimonas muris TaxID=1796652 RepID=UPI002494900D|nr:autotransporter outer membrane beta-barrel domain-containing protein [Turicimonas muris]